MDLLLPFIALLIFFLLGIPIAFSLGLSGILGILLITGNLKMLVAILGMVTYDSVAVYVMTTLPMFILMAFLASAGGLVNGLYRATYNWTSNIRGGVAVGTVFACGVFGAMSGVSTAAASVMSEIAIPNMRRLGYSDALSGGVVGVGATLDILIPPSVAFVVYAIMTSTSVGKLLLAGIVPGIILGIFLIFCILVWVWVRPQDAPRAERVPWPERWRSLYEVWPSLSLVLIVIILLYTGAATPTEVGALGAFFAMIIGVILRRLTWVGALNAFKAAMRSTAMIFMIIIGAFIFGHFMTVSGLPDKVVTAVIAMNLNRWIVMIGVIGSYFVVSMFMDELPLMLIYLQITFPLIIKLGFDPIWYGIVTSMMIMMGLVFPPVGVLAFVVSAVGKIDLVKVYHGTSILVIAIVMTLILIMIFPEIVLWLPSHMIK